MQRPEIKPYPSLISAEVLRRAEKLGSANLCDGMIGLGIKRDGCMDAAISPVDPKQRLVGTAMTVEAEGGNNVPIHVALYTASPGYVMVVDGRASEDAPYLGDLIVSTAKALGFCGIVIDGYIRDRVTIKESGFPVYTRGYMPRGPRKDGPGQINAVIACAGTQVKPGDLILGDADGVAVVPRERLLEVLENAEKKVAYEEKRRLQIEQFDQVYQKGQGDYDPDFVFPWVKELIGKGRG